MKFGKQLEVSANPEWRQYYVQYKKLKRLIKRVAFEVDRAHHKREKSIKNKQLTPANLPRPSDTSPPPLILNIGEKKVTDIDLGEASPLLPNREDMDLEGIADAKREFWEMTNLNLQIANDFYRAKITCIAKTVKEFEQMLKDDEKFHGHVHSRPRSFSHEADRGFAALQEAYDILVDLKAFVNMNHAGFRKIVKKFDKTIKENTLDTFMERLNKEEFYSSSDIDSLLERLFAITSRCVLLWNSLN